MSQTHCCKTCGEIVSKYEDDHVCGAARTTPQAQNTDCLVCDGWGTDKTEDDILPCMACKGSGVAPPVPHRQDAMPDSDASIVPASEPSQAEQPPASTRDAAEPTNPEEWKAYYREVAWNLGIRLNQAYGRIIELEAAIAATAAKPD